PVGSIVLGLALAPLARLAVDLGHRPARDGPRMAPQGLSALLALEVPIPSSGTSANRLGAPQPHPPHGQREPHLGSASDSSRTPVPSTYSPDRLTPLAGGIRDGAHPRGAPPPPCPGSAAAHSVARVRPWPTISGSGSRCSSLRTWTGSPADAVRRSPRHGQGIPVESIQSRARHRRLPGRAR